MWNHADPGNVLIYANMVKNFPDAVLQAFTGLDGVRMHKFIHASEIT